MTDISKPVGKAFSETVIQYTAAHHYCQKAGTLEFDHRNLAHVWESNSTQKYMCIRRGQHSAGRHWNNVDGQLYNCTWRWSRFNHLKCNGSNDTHQDALRQYNRYELKPIIWCPAGIGEGALTIVALCRIQTQTSVVQPG